MNTRMTHLLPVAVRALRSQRAGEISAGLKAAEDDPNRGWGVQGNGERRHKPEGGEGHGERRPGGKITGRKDRPNQAKHPTAAHATSFTGANRRGRDPQQREREQATATNKTPTEAATEGSHNGTETQRAPTGLREPGQPPDGARTTNKPAKRAPLTLPRGAPPPPAARQQGPAA